MHLECYIVCWTLELCAFIVVRPAIISNCYCFDLISWIMEAFAKAPVRESAGEDVPSILHVDIGVFSYIGCSICIPQPMEDSINY